MYVEIFFALLFYLIIIACVCIFWIFPLFDTCIVSIFPSIWLAFSFSQWYILKIKKKKLTGVLHLCYTYRFGENCHLTLLNHGIFLYFLISLSFVLQFPSREIQSDLFINILHSNATVNRFVF